MAQYLRAAINDITYRIIAAAIEVHRHFGPGLLEAIYQRCMARELAEARLKFEADCPLRVVYKAEEVGRGCRLDFWVEGLVVVEVKAVKQLGPIHDAQLLTYLKLSGAPIGLLINFNVPVLRQGVRRMLNKQHELVERLDRL